jgi:hypothetical protein
LASAIRAIVSPFATVARRHSEARIAHQAVVAAPTFKASVRTAIIPGRPLGAASHMRTVAVILDRQIERGEKIARTHHRAGEMLGSIEYELQCLSAELAPVTRPVSDHFISRVR